MMESDEGKARTEERRKGKGKARRTGNGGVKVEGREEEGRKGGGEGGKDSSRLLVDAEIRGDCSSTQSRWCAHEGLRGDAALHGVTL